MSQEAAIEKPAAPGTGIGLGSLIFIGVPVLLFAACLAAKFGILPVFPGLRVAMIFALLLSLMLTGMPISISLGLTVLTFLFTLTQVPLDAVALKLFTGIEKFEIMAVPFFILAGNLMTHGGVARRMIRFATSMVGHWPGGLGLAGIAAAALFSAVSGSSPATVVAIGSIILPAMLAIGYPLRFGAGIITTSGALGNLIPPSIIMVIYAVATSGMQAVGPTGERVSSASVGQLFMAGMIPGIILAMMLGATTWYRAWKNDYPRVPRASWGESIVAFRDAFWGILLIVIVIGGIYSGAFTPTEAAAMSAVYAFIVEIFIYRDMKLSQVPNVLLGSANMSAMLLYIITNAVLFSFLMTHENIPQAMAAWITETGIGWVTFLMLVNLLLLLAGNVMEPSSIVLIMAPILFPIAMKLGIDPVHFGIVIVVNMEIGMCHPPVGLNLYVASGITKLGITELTIAVMPWLITLLVFLVIVTYVPELSLWLPRTLGMLN
jgi:C4-dicarboxylate transporter, DctM subunit